MSKVELDVQFTSRKQICLGFVLCGSRLSRLKYLTQDTKPESVELSSTVYPTPAVK